MAQVTRITQAGGTHRLRDLFESWGVPSEFHAGMSPCWECRLAPSCPTDADILSAVMDGVPLLAPPALAADAFRAVGDDAIDFIQRPEWDQFPKPRIAMIGGWGAPGTHVLGEDHLTLVRSFSEVMSSEQKINLQMFHRDGPDGPTIPRLPDLLRWPLPELLDGEDGSWGVKCDAATRVSRQGAVTWWHLDDGGEFVLQVGLPISERSLKGPVLLGPTGRPVVKLFIFADKQHYDFITQDAVTNETSRFSQLHLFETPTEYLPVQTPDGPGALPTFWVAPLEAGGQLLLSPANVPHCVITLQDCVMVEVRKIFVAFLDEVTHFLQRASLWLEPPIFYPFISDDLRDPAKVRVIVRQLMHALQRTAAPGAGEPDACGAAPDARRVGAAENGAAARLDESGTAAGAIEASCVRSPAPSAPEDACAGARVNQSRHGNTGVAEVASDRRPANAPLSSKDCPPTGAASAGDGGPHKSRGGQDDPACVCCSVQGAGAPRDLGGASKVGSTVEANLQHSRSAGQRCDRGDQDCSVGGGAQASVQSIEQRTESAVESTSGGHFAEELRQCRRSRAFHSLQALMGCDFVAMDEATKAAAAAALASATEDDLRPDPRAPVHSAMSDSMRRRVKGIAELARCGPLGVGHPAVMGDFAAYVHVLGRPRWGPVRGSAAQAKLDRKLLLEAKRSGRLDAALADLHASPQA